MSLALIAAPQLGSNRLKLVKYMNAVTRGHHSKFFRLDGTIWTGLSYIDAEEAQRREKRKGLRTGKMKEAGEIFRIVGIVLLVIFVLAVGIPLVLALAGVALGIVGMLVGLAIALIKVAIVVAIIYLIIVGIRAVLR